jgi:hypothetical protein
MFCDAGPNDAGHCRIRYMPLPLPESLAEHFPMIGRAEMLYINHRGSETAGLIR